MERKSGFTIPKKVKKSSHLNPDEHPIISSMKNIKTSDKHNGLQDTLLQPSRLLVPTISTNMNNILSTKQLEPVQVHSVVSSVGQPPKQHQQQSSSSVKSIVHSSASSSTTKQSQSSNEIKFVFKFF